MAEDKMKGLILNLFKRKLLPCESDLHLYDDLIIGFHDGVAFTYPQSWSQFAPDGVDQLLNDLLKKRDPECRWEQVFSEISPIKLLFPREECRRRMESEIGFDFSCWEKDAHREEPLFAALLLNVTKQFIASTAGHMEAGQQEMRRLSAIAQRVGEMLRLLEPEDTRAKTEKLHCGLFQCIGYYDYALLFSCDDWNLIYRLINKLKAGGDKFDVPGFLSSSYLLLGMNTVQGAWEKVNRDAKCEMLIQLNLLEGCSADIFYQDFLAEISKMDADIQKFWTKRAHFYQTNGGVDCMIITDSHGMKYLLKEFSEGGLLMPDRKNPDCFFSQHIVTIQTSVRRRLKPCSELGRVLDSRERCLDDSEVQNLYQWISDMQQTELFRTDNAFARRAHGLRRQLAQYENLIVADHVFDIRSILRPAYFILFSNLSSLSTMLQPRDQDLTEEKQTCLKERVYQLLDEFRDKVESFQDSLQLSDPHFIEGSRINHPSVGSATKLLLTYNDLLNRFSEEVGQQIRKSFAKQNRMWCPCTYRFLLSCGDRDRSKAWNLSVQIPDTRQTNDRFRSEKVLIVMNIPERSILDIRGTLIRSIHELWHFCGHRMRRRRCRLIVGDASRQLSMLIGYTMLPRSVWLNPIMDKSLDYHVMDGKEQERVRCVLQQQFDACLQKLIQDISETLEAWIMEKLETLEPDHPYDFYYGQKIFDVLIDLTADLFVDRRDSDDTLWKRIYCSYEEQRCVMFQTANRILGGPSIEDALWQIAYRKQNSIIDPGVQYNIQMFLDYLAGNTITHRLTADIGTDCWEYWVRDYTVNRVYSQLASVYREAFSDNMACCTTQCSMEEYIFSFIYDNPNISKCLLPDDDRALRIGAVLEHRFHCSLEPSHGSDAAEPARWQPDRARMGQLYQELFGTVADDQAIQEIMDAVDRICSSYAKSKLCIQNLKEYLSITEKVHGLDSLDIPESCQTMRRIYSGARHMETHEDVMNTIQEIMHAWSHMAMDQQCTEG